VYGIVKQSNGYIWAYSEPGRGTTMKVYLPRVDQPTEPEEVRPVSTVTHAGSETILLVEDEEGVRSLITLFLERNGYNVLVSRQAEEALQLCEGTDEPIHLLLTDLILPRLSGRELAERIAALRPDIKMLFISGYTDDAVLRHGVLGSGTPFLQKPFSMEVLLQKIREVLGQAVAANSSTSLS
jgi:CheY-like chemotaxis protein